MEAPDPFSVRLHKPLRQNMNAEINKVERVIGLDAHPDTFTAALLRGPTPAAAVTEKVFNKLPLGHLRSWAEKNTTPQDVFVLEASGNSFHIVGLLAKVQRQALVLESTHLGKLKEAHANNDKISAVRIGKAYLAGTARVVWVPDPKTQERRDLFHIHRKAVKRTTQLRNRLQSYLSDNGVRLKRGTRLTQAEVSETIRQAHDWLPRQWQLIEGLLMELRHAEQQRQHWRSLIAQEVLADPLLLSIVRLCGVREMVAFALGALVGDIKRFSHPKKLVKYVGLNPAFDDSGNDEWTGGIGGHGRSDLRCLLIEAAHAILRCSKTALAYWGKKLLRRKGALNLVVAAVARKLTVAVWYLMMGRWTTLEEIDRRLSQKIGKIITQVGPAGLKILGKTRKAFREQICQTLKSGRQYILDPDKKFAPKPKVEPTLTLAQEYGLR
jgi:transposase